jgi:hypothetical protein
VSSLTAGAHRSEVAGNARAISHTALTAACRSAGFKRVELVRLVVEGSGIAAEATGVLNRYPRTVPISLSTADSLIAAGVPMRMEHRQGANGTAR